MFDHLDGHQRRLFATLCLNFAVLGIVMALFGAALPQIIDRYAWNYLESGAVLAALSLGSLCANLAGGHFLRRLPPGLLLLGGSGAAVAGLVFFGAWGPWWINALLAFMMGLGQGLPEIITNSVVVRFERPGQSRLMNMMHAWFGVGAVAGPLGLGLLSQAFDFRLVFVASGVLQAVVLALMVVQRFPDLAKDHDAGGEGDLSPGQASPAERTGTPRADGGHRFLLTFFMVTLFVYVGVELGMSSWIAEFQVRLRDVAQGVAALSVSVFWAGLLLGRLFLGFVYHGNRQARLLLILAAGSVPAFVLAILSGNHFLAAAGIFLTGLGFSGCYPVIMTLAGQYFRGSTKILGYCSMAGATGLLVFPLLTGGLALVAGLEAAMRVMAAFDLVLAFLAFGHLVWSGRKARATAGRR